MKKRSLFLTWLVGSVLSQCVYPSLSLANLLQHQDVHTLTVPGSIFPPVLGGNWTVTSLLNILTGEPHTGPVGEKFPFKSVNIFTANAASFTPLFVLGSPVGFPVPGPGANLADQGVYKIALTIDGPAVFDYSMPWTVRVEDNRKVGTVEYKFSINIEPELTVGPVGGKLGGAGVDVTFKPAEAGPTLFETIGLPKQFDLLLTPTAAAGGQGFFASGGRIVVDGLARDQAVGKATLLYDNIHLATGEGPLVADFTRALGAGLVRTQVFDDHTSVKEPPPPPVQNLIIGPRGGAKSPDITFDALNGKLSFTDATIDFLNLVGNGSLDPAFAGDPLMGATIRVTDFTLSGPRGDGFLFSGGTMTIFKGDQTLFAGDIPDLLVADDTMSIFDGVNIFAPLVIGQIDTSASPFLAEYADFLAGTRFPPELFGSTLSPITGMIRNGQSFTAGVEGFSVGFSNEVPEPATLVLFAAGAFGVISCGWLHRRRNGGARTS